MKISFTVPVPEKYGDYRGFVEKLNVLIALGYNGVELAVQDPNKLNIRRIRKIVRNSGLEVSAIATGSAFTKERLSLSSPFGIVRERARQRIKDQITFASLFGHPKVIIGLIRGNIRYLSNFPELYHLPSFERDKYFSRLRKFFTENLRECDNFAQLHGITLALETINRYEMDHLNTLEETAEFLKSNRLGSIRILADTYHMNIEEKSIPESLTKTARHLGYVHIADNNREAPGKGHFNFKESFEILKKIKYEGYVSAEIIPCEANFYKEAVDTMMFLRSLGL